MQIVLGATDKERNSTFTPTPARGYECYLKEPTSVVRPVVTIKDDANLSNFNYAFIPEFRRYYYVTETTSINAHMWQLALEVDVLATYREQILSATAFIQYAESDYNTMIPDSRLPLSDRCENRYYEIPFPPYSEEGCYVINFGSKDTSGETGMAESFVATAAGMTNFAKALFQKDKLKELLQYYNNPLDMMISAVWLPIGIMFAGGGGGSATLGDSDIVFSGTVAKKVYQGAFSPSIELPYKATLPDGSETYADYRNVEPYTQYLITLPGVGEVEIPMASYIQDGSSLPDVRINYAISIIDGKVYYEFVANDNAVIMMCEGNIGTPVPVCNSDYNTMGALSSYVTTIGGGLSTIGGMITGNPLAVGGGLLAMSHGAVGTVTNAHQASNGVSGNLGGFAGARFCEKCKITVRPYATSDTVYNVAKNVGGPLFAKRKLGDLHGYVKCNGVRLKCNCTQEEHLMLSNFLEASANYSYGGVIIE